MSRSRNKTPLRGSVSGSEKKDKRLWHRKLRRVVKHMLAVNPESELPKVKEVSNPWDMKKDGKAYFNPKEHPEKLRK